MGERVSWLVRKSGSEIFAEKLPTPIQVIPKPYEITQPRDVHARARQDNCFGKINSVSRDKYSREE